MSGKGKIILITSDYPFITTFVCMKQLQLRWLSLVNFKNYEHTAITFSSKFNCIAGENGGGKTNLLDAIYYLSFTKSYFNSVDSQNIRHQTPFFVIQGEFDLDGEVNEVFCGQKRGERKQLKLNKNETTRFADHIGLFNVVIASPTDVALILDGSEIRRKFSDSIISQYNRRYLDTIIAYTKVLLQRNTLLKQFSDKNYYDADSLLIWTTQLIELGKSGFEERQKFSKEFEPVFQKYYKLISGGKEKVEMTYKSQLQDNDFEALLNEALDKDRYVGYTTVGIHRDDWEFVMDKNPVRKFASQGQQKSYLLAIKLAQFEFIKNHTQQLPILMLDDIHDKLDAMRVEQLVQLVSSTDFGQIFITDTSVDRIKSLFHRIHAPIKILKVSEGAILELPAEKLKPDDAE